jgi:general secretion pathway protein D
VQDTDNRTVASVPCLGDIPVLGHLFKTTRNRKQKTNLLIFLTPHVIRSAADLEAISRVKRNSFRQHSDTPEGGPRTLQEKMDTYMERPASTGGNP